MNESDNVINYSSLRQGMFCFPHFVTYTLLTPQLKQKELKISNLGVSNNLFLFPLFFSLYLGYRQTQNRMLR